MSNQNPSANLRPNVWKYTVRGRVMFSVCHQNGEGYQALVTPDERLQGKQPRTAGTYQELGAIPSKEQARARARRLYGYTKFGN